MLPKDPPDHGDYTLNSVRNAARLLVAFSLERPELGVTELSRALGLGKSTVHRLVSTLAAFGLVELNPETRKYRLGLKLIELGTVRLAQIELREQARPYLRRLSAQTQETVHLAILDEAAVIYIEKIESPQPLRVSSWVGKRNPAYCTGVGKTLLAYQPAATIEELVASGLMAHTPTTLTDPARLRAELAAIRTRGYALDNEEFQVGVRCVAAPVRDWTGQVVAALSVTAPAQRMSGSRAASLVTPVIETAAEISRQMGYVPRPSRTLRGGSRP